MVKLLLLISATVFFSAFLINFGRILRAINGAQGILLRVCIIWVLMFVGLGVFFTRSNYVEGVTSLDSSAMFQFILFGLAGLLCIASILDKQPSKYLTVPLKALFLYSVLGILSALYSPNPMISFYKASIVMIDVLLFALCIQVFTRHNKGHWPLEICYFLVTLFCFGAVLGAIIRPEVGLKPATGAIGVLLYGTFPAMNANELGSFGFFAFIVGLRRIFEKASFSQKYYYYAQTLLGFTVLFLAQSRTALVAAVIAILLMAIGIPKMRRLAFGALLVMTILIGYLIANDKGDIGQSAVDSAVEYAQRGQSEGGFKSLNDRADTWLNIGLGLLSESPVWGHGFDVGAGYNLDKQHGKSHLHNSHFQILANTGLVGYLVWLIFFAYIAFFIFNQTRRRFPAKDIQSRYYIETGVVVLAIILRTMTGSVLVTHQWSLLIFVAAYIFYESNRRINKAEYLRALANERKSLNKSV